jgi:hypothetical protein
MKSVHLRVSPSRRGIADEQPTKLDPASGHLKQKLFQDTWVHAAQAITVHQSHVLKERSCKEFPLRHNMESPAAAGRKCPADRQLALDDRPGELGGGLDFDESLAAVGHLDEEVRHDVT